MSLTSWPRDCISVRRPRALACKHLWTTHLLQIPADKQHINTTKPKLSKQQAYINDQSMKNKVRLLIEKLSMDMDCTHVLCIVYICLLTLADIFMYSRHTLTSHSSHIVAYKLALISSYNIFLSFLIYCTLNWSTASCHLGGVWAGAISLWNQFSLRNLDTPISVVSSIVSSHRLEFLRENRYNWSFTL